MLPAFGALAGAGVLGSLAGGGGAAAGGAAGAGLLGAFGPSLLSGGLSLLGGLFGNENQTDNLERQLALRREELQNAVTWRVADARRAGIHPLYALGMQAPQSFPIALDDKVGPAIAEMGQGLGSALHRSMDAVSRDKHQMEMALGSAQLDVMDAQAQMYRSEAMRNMQAPAAPMPGLGIQRESPGAVSGKFEGFEGQDAVVPGVIDVKPAEVVSPKAGDKSMVAGINPYGEEQWYHNRLPMMVPRTQGESIEEIWSEMSAPAFMGWILRNGQLYGEGWINDFINMRYFGRTPLRDWSQFKNMPKPAGAAVMDMELKNKLKNEYNRLVDKYGPELRNGAADAKRRFKAEWAEIWKKMGEQVDRR